MERNIFKYYLYQIFQGILFAIPTIVIFWQNNGLSLTEIMVLQSLYAISFVLLEVPTGYFADRVGRKFSLLLAGIVYPLGYLIYGFGNNFGQFLIAEIFLALAFSLISGADSAFVYDSLKAIGKEDDYKKVYGNGYFINIIFVGISGILGGLIVKYGLGNRFESVDKFRLSLFLSVPFLAIMFPIALSMKEPPIQKLVIQKNYLSDIWKIIKTQVLKKDKVFWLIIYSGVIFSFNQAVLHFYQPYYQLTGVDIAYFGLIFAGFQIFSAISGKFSHKIEKKLGSRYSLILLVILVGVSYLLMGNFIFLFSFSFCFIQQFVRGFYKITISDYINKLINSNIRATVLSIQNLFGKLLYSLIIPFFGYFADVFSLVQSLTLIGVSALIFGGTLLFVLHKKKVI